jgi:hypothetical protein
VEFISLVSVAEKKLSQLQLKDEFAGALPNIPAAEAQLRRTGLAADPVMRSLLEMRRDGANQLLTRNRRLPLSSEAKSNLKVVGRLKLPAFFKLSAAYDRIVQEQEDYLLTVLVRF